MLGMAALLSLLLVAASGRPHRGRRLFQTPDAPSTRVPRPTTFPAKPPRGPAAGAQSQAAPLVEAPGGRALTANETVGLLRERELLQSRVAQIDGILMADRDEKRRALTAQYEREMQKLDEDEAAAAGGEPATGLGRGGGLALREQVAAAVRSHQEHGAPHQDIEHQDIDIDVMMMHIDKDGDGVITPTEAYGAQRPILTRELRNAATASGGAWRVWGPALLGCSAAVLCYLSVRSLLRPRARAGAHVGAHGHRGMSIPASKRRKNASNTNAPIPFYNREASREC